MQVDGGRIYEYNQEPEFTPDELAIAIALIEGGMRRAELAVSNPWGNSLLGDEKQAKLDKARELIDQANKLINEIRG